VSGLRILVCVKRVPAPGAQITLTPDARAVDARNLAFTTSPHEECAVEAALQLVEAHGGDITVLTVGPPEAEEQLRFSVSVGVQHAILVSNEEMVAGDDPDPQATARTIADTARTLEAEGGPFDVLLFGNESADSGGFQVGVRVAYALGRPMVNGAKGLSVDGDVAHVQREADAGRETYELPMPAVVGVKEGINLPRYPTMKGRLASKKAELNTIEATAAPGGLTKLVLKRPVEKRSETIILGTGPDAAPAVVDVLEQIGVL
jgi:electron transfer flavoprotein beta subunit